MTARARGSRTILSLAAGFALMILLGCSNPTDGDELAASDDATSSASTSIVESTTSLVAADNYCVRSDFSGDNLEQCLTELEVDPETACYEDAVTLEVDACFADFLANVEGDLDARWAEVEAARPDGLPPDEPWEETIQQLTAAAAAYRDQMCDAVWSSWADGTIRTSQGLRCRIDLVQQQLELIEKYELVFANDPASTTTPVTDPPMTDELEPTSTTGP